VILTLIHPLDYLYWLLGPHRTVKASIRDVGPLETPVREDWAEITVEFQGGPIGQIHLDYWQSPPVHHLTVWGERGRAVLDFHAGQLAWETGDRREVEGVPAGFERNVMFLDEMSHFLSCVARRTRTDIPLEEGIAVLDLALRAKQSAKEGLGA
jgi:predicted dehydrogenase